MTDAEMNELIRLLKMYNAKSALGPRMFDALALIVKQAQMTLAQRESMREDDAKGWKD